MVCVYVYMANRCHPIWSAIKKPRTAVATYVANDQTSTVDADQKWKPQKIKTTTTTKTNFEHENDKSNKNLWHI